MQVPYLVKLFPLLAVLVGVPKVYLVLAVLVLVVIHKALAVQAVAVTEVMTS